MDDEGMKIDMLEAKLAECDAKGIKPKFIYTIPTFQNPAGITMNLERRKKLLQIAKDRQIPVIEDNPYGDLRFVGETVPSLAVLDKEGLVINLRTFSKIMFPGIRVGWIFGPKDAVAKIMTAKEASDLCTPVLTQAAVAEFIKAGVLKTHIPKITASYGHKREVMVEAMKKEFPSDAKWTKAEGGMFIWATLNEKVNCTDLFPKALENNVAYIVGSAFFAEPGRGHNTMRLNFSFPTEENIKEGIRRLGSLLKSI
jgi:2-aminoadipate transaminase